MRKWSGWELALLLSLKLTTEANNDSRYASIAVMALDVLGTLRLDEVDLLAGSA